MSRRKLKLTPLEEAVWLKVYYERVKPHVLAQELGEDYEDVIGAIRTLKRKAKAAGIDLWPGFREGPELTNVNWQRLDNARSIW